MVGQHNGITYLRCHWSLQQSSLCHFFNDKLESRESHRFQTDNLRRIPPSWLLCSLMSLIPLWQCICPPPPPPPTEFNNSLPELLCSDDDSGNEDVLDMEYTEAEAESLKRNAEVSARPHRIGMRCTRCTYSHKNQARSVMFLNWPTANNGISAFVLYLIISFHQQSSDWRLGQLFQTHQCCQPHREHIFLWYTNVFFSSVLKCFVTAREPVCENKNENLADVFKG